jgi:hypothetical protein
MVRFGARYDYVTLESDWNAASRYIFNDGTATTDWRGGEPFVLEAVTVFRHKDK